MYSTITAIGKFSQLVAIPIYSPYHLIKPECLTPQPYFLYSSSCADVRFAWSLSVIRKIAVSIGHVHNEHLLHKMYLLLMCEIEDVSTHE